MLYIPAMCRVIIPEVVRIKTLAAKAIGVAFSVIGGLAVGKVSVID